MPELPEVETVRRGLQTALKDQKISRVQPMREGLRFPFPEGLAKRLEGRKILDLHRRAKYILCELDSGEFLLLHLGMSGKVLVYQAKRNQFNKHDHLIIWLDDGKEIAFNDARRFGIVDLLKGDELTTHKLLKNLGPEPLGNEFTPEYLFGKLKQSSVAIKTRLMDSHVVVGVGNIYASEALFRAGIRPDRLSKKVTKNECKKLVEAVVAVLQDAIDSGGSTLRDYVRSSGDIGLFQHSFRVYGRVKEPCVQCTKPIERIVQNGRSSFYCKRCQL